MLPGAAGADGEAVSRRCRACGRELTEDEVAVTKKLLNRGAVSFFCVDCLAAYFAVTPQDIRERIAYFRRMGCTLFFPAPAVENDPKKTTIEP